MRRSVTQALSVILALAAMMATITPAFAAETTIQPLKEFDASIAAERMLAGETVLVASEGTDMAAKRQALAAVQAYVDAISVSSVTPTVKGAIQNVGKQSEMTKFYLAKDENEYTDKEMSELSATAGSTVEDINSFLCGKLNYDHISAKEKLSLNSSVATAKGALDTGKAICEGYANAFTILAEQVCVRTIKVRGTLSNGEFHVMNMVETEEGLMVVDVTINDSSRNNTRFLLCSFEEYARVTGFVPVIDAESAFELKYAGQEI